MEKIVDIDKYTTEGLKAIGLAFGITEYPSAKHNHKPNKQEIADEINLFIDNENKNKGKILETEDLNRIAEEENANKKNKKKKKTTAEIKRELEMQVRVVVRRNTNHQNYENDSDGRMEYKVWGNAEVGHNSTRLIFNRPWHIPYGCYLNLISAKTSKLVVDTKGGTSRMPEQKTFDVQVLPGMTEDRFKQIREKQLIIESKLDTI